MDKLHWGLIGVSPIAHEMAQALLAVNGEIYGVCATTREHAQNFADKYNIVHAYQDADALIADPNVDVVYIATPHSLHYKFMQQAIQANKHVFCEKSITVNSRQLEACVLAAGKKNLTICDGTTLFHMPLYKKLRIMLDGGVLGKIKMIQVNFGSCKDYDVNSRLFSREKAGGALLDIGVYAVSFARFFMSSQPNVVLTTAAYAETGVDETSGILLKNQDGEMAVIALTFLAKQPKRGIVACEKGFIEIYDYPRAAKATITYTENGRTEVIKAGNTQNALQYEVRDMQHYIQTGNDAQNLLFVREVMDILTSVRNQWGMVYPFELTQQTE